MQLIDRGNKTVQITFRYLYPLVIKRLGCPAQLDTLGGILMETGFKGSCLFLFEVHIRTEVVRFLQQNLREIRIPIVIEPAGQRSPVSLRDHNPRFPLDLHHSTSALCITPN